MSFISLFLRLLLFPFLFFFMTCYRLLFLCLLLSNIRRPHFHFLLPRLLIHSVLHIFCLVYSPPCPHSHIIVHCLLFTVSSLSVSSALLIMLWCTFWNKINISNISIWDRLTCVRNLRKLWPILVRKFKKIKIVRAQLNLNSSGSDKVLCRTTHHPLKLLRYFETT
jgi:hypothetical protein